MQRLSPNQRQNLKLPFAFLLLLAIPRTSGAEFYRREWQSRHQPERILGLEAQFTNYSTNQNYDAYGSTSLPPGFRNYSRQSADLHVGAGLSQKFTLYGTVSWARVQVDHELLAGSSFGFTDQTVGANYRLIDKKISLDLQLEVAIPAYNNSLSTLNLSPYVGDGSTDITAGGFLRLPLSSEARYPVELRSGAGFTSRTNNFSSAIPWTMDVRFNGDRFLGSAGLMGVYSLQTDPGIGSPAASLGTAGSYVTNAVNPSLASIRGQVGYHVSGRARLTFMGAKSISGQNAPQGFLFGLGFQLQLGKKTASKHPENPVKMTPMEYGHSNQGLVYYHSSVPEARVLRANDRLNLVKINKGSKDGLAVGQIFDIFSLKQGGTAGGGPGGQSSGRSSPEEAIARGRVSSVKSEEAVLTITEYFREVWIEEGFVARQPVQ